MDRSIYVGTVLAVQGEDGVKVDHVLTEFLGEGNSGIVFSVAPRDHPTESKHVLKFFKPQPRFELGVLHHSLRIAEELYPNHPLLMTPDARIARLVTEMQQRIESPGVIFQVAPFVDLMYGTIEGLIHQFLPRYAAGTLPPDFLCEERGFMPALDEGLALHVERLLEEDAIYEPARDFAAHCVDAIREWGAVQSGPTLSGNRLYKLLGLHLIGFVSWSELLDILAHANFTPPVQSDELQLLAAACSMLHYRAGTLRDRKDRDFEDVFEAALTAARLVESVAAQLFSGGLEDLRANALNWEARTLLLKNDADGAREAFMRVLDVACSVDALAERHDALLELTTMQANRDTPQVRAWVDEIRSIRQRLGVG